MRLVIGKKRSERLAKLWEWHRWFAWYPVCLGNYDWRWLETVERKSEWIGAYDGYYRFNQYRAA